MFSYCAGFQDQIMYMSMKCVNETHELWGIKSSERAGGRGRRADLGSNNSNDGRPEQRERSNKGHASRKIRETVAHVQINRLKKTRMEENMSHNSK